MPKEEVIEHINSYVNIVWNGIAYQLYYYRTPVAGLAVQYGEPGKARSPVILVSFVEASLIAIGFD